jgi:predicted dehydrogenase
MGERSLTVSEAGRRLRADLSAQTLTVTPENGKPETLALGSADNLAAEIANFLEAIETETEPLVTGRAGLEALKVADMIRAAVSAEQSRTGVMDG